MLKKIFFQLWTLLHFLPGVGQKLYLQTLNKLDAAIPECSGLTALPDNRLVMINDSGNDPEVFFTDSTGNILHRQYLQFAQNHDWEDLTHSETHVFIGDFGNNANRRKDLKIYRAGIKGDSLYDDGVIHFSYGDQKAFPPDEEHMNYDMESMIFYNDSIFLFSKNRTKPFTGYTYQYGMPATPGTYEVFPTDSFKTGKGVRMETYWVCAAALSPSHQRLVLLGYDKLWLFDNFEGSGFLKGDVMQFQFKDLTQKESVDFLSETKLVITDETRDSFGGGYVYHTRLPGKNEPVVDVSPTEITDSVMVQIHGYEGKVLWEIFSTDGNRPLAGNFQKTKNSGLHKLDVAELPAGGYVLNIILNGKPNAFKLKKLWVSSPGKEGK